MENKCINPFFKYKVFNFYLWLGGLESDLVGLKTWLSTAVTLDELFNQPHGAAGIKRAN